MGYIKGGLQKALYWWERAALEGSTHSMKWLGSFYSGGYPGREDPIKAEYWYEKAAATGDTEAMVDYGTALKYQKQFEKADHWYRRAADAGDAKGMSRLTLMNHYNLKNYKTARFWYEKQIDAGDVRGLVGLGLLHKDGLGTEKDIDEAIYLFRKAAEAGDDFGMENLARTYEFYQKDYKKAKVWYEQLADIEKTSGYLGLAKLYFEGKGVGKDYGKAIFWYQKAAEAGNFYAKGKLKELEGQ